MRVGLKPNISYLEVEKHLLSKLVDPAKVL